jgi:ligand-binding sensor domain-containing protein
MGTLWVADRNNGLVMINSSETRYLKPDGPSNIYVTSLEVEKDILVAVAGGITSGLNNLFRIGELYRYKEKEWSNWTNSNIKDLINIAFDPQDPSHYYIATWGYGLLEFKDEVLVNQYRTENSSLQSILQGDFIRIGGLVFDRDNNLWVSNSGVSEPLSVLKTDGEWQSFEIANAVNAPNIGEMIFTEDGNLWMILPGGYGLFVFNSNGTVSNEDDDEYKKLSVVDIDNSVISNFIYSIAQDRQGNIWLGTNKGIVVYYSPSRVFNSNEFYAQTILVPRNDNSGFGDPLLGTETVTAIKVDGANRKWLGTRNGGVFLVSEDGLKQIHAFNIDNSPLLSNSINDIAINENTGEVFFATNSGIISYVSDAIGPDDDFSDVYVFPNPVRETYFGDIVITGLIENAYVKITDLNGNLVHETRSLGGNAIWNGNNLSGKRVSTGVYLVFLTNEDGSLTHVTKLLFIH